ncbi:hypothetical protein PILCRDRAFT_193996 [Piloderma croceum F 1598]|uniref:Uncharacterized protein n=1 Tax=Piloderma croceum (strain F 1598) TaxID=765440 RepID=A0A0C3GDC1_PILCF|nr:hypothetical protein PILCRDRAFT_193996 [Piloderma croceum F 1598]
MINRYHRLLRFSGPIYTAMMKWAPTVFSPNYPVQFVNRSTDCPRYTLIIAVTSVPPVGDKIQPIMSAHTGESYFR